MGNQVDKKFTWVIKNFSSLQYEQVYSDIFVIGDCKWCLMAYPNGSGTSGYLSLFLEAVDSAILPFGWRRHTKFSIIVVNQLSEKLSLVKGERLSWFCLKTSVLGFQAVLPHTKLYAKNGGFLVNDELKIVAEVEVLEVVGKLDVPKESEISMRFFPLPNMILPTTQPLKRMKLEETSSEQETIDVNGFQLLPSQVEFVRRVFKTYPDIALQLRGKNQPLRSSCLYVLLGLIETLCKSLDELSDADLVEADNSLNYLKCSGIKVDLLEKKLEEVKKKNKEEHYDETRTQELEEELKGVKQNCSDVETLLEKKKEELKDLKQKCSDIEEKVLAARAPALTLDDDVV